MVAGLTGVAFSRMGMEPKMYQAGQAGGGNTAENAGASAVQSPAYLLDLTKNKDKTTPETQRLKRTGQIECQTCKERTYQDGSNDPGVSFKAPGHIDPASSAAVVMSHEQEHVGNEQANAQKDGRRVVSQSVRLFTAVCPECGKVYVSGGETRTTTASDSKAQQNNEALGQKVDMIA